MLCSKYVKCVGKSTQGRPQCITCAARVFLNRLPSLLFFYDIHSSSRLLSDHFFSISKNLLVQDLFAMVRPTGFLPMQFVGTSLARFTQETSPGWGSTMDRAIKSIEERVGRHRSVSFCRIDNCVLSVPNDHRGQNPVGV